MEELLETQLQEDRTTTATGRHYLCGGGRAGRRAGLDAVKVDECGLATRPASWQHQRFGVGRAPSTIEEDELKDINQP